MQIDRSKLVTLTFTTVATMFAVMACKVTTEETSQAAATDPDASVLSDPNVTAEPGSSGEVDPGTTTSSSSSSGAPVSTDGGRDGSTTADGGAVNMCLADTGANADCDNAGACSFGVCQWATSKMKKGSAREVVTCLKAIQTGDCESEYQKVGACNEAAQKKSCTDAEATTLCNQAAADCGDGQAEITKAECVAIVGGLNATGRNDFRTCMTYACGLTRGCALPH